MKEALFIAFRLVRRAAGESERVRQRIDGFGQDALRRQQRRQFGQIGFQRVDPDPDRGRAQRGPEGALRALKAVLRRPSLAEPEGRRIFGGEALHRRQSAGPRFLVAAEKGAQDAVDKAGRLGRAEGLHELHRLVDRRGIRDRIHVKNLVEPEPQRLQHRGRQLPERTGAVPGEQAVQTDAPLQRAVKERRGERLIPRVERGILQRGVEHQIGIAAGGHPYRGLRRQYARRFRHRGRPLSFFKIKTCGCGAVGCHAPLC